MRGKALIVVALAALLTPLAALPAQSTTPCFGVLSTMTAVPGEVTFGTAGDDVIVGTAGDDDIRGGRGRDRICGLGGNDDLRGGAGRDRISGGDGDDLIDGNAGENEVLSGGAGNDTLHARGQGTTAAGGPGADTLVSFGAFLVLRGNGGNDHITSGYRNDLDAGTGADHCALDMDVAGVGCETQELLCGSLGAELPGGPLTSLTTASGDFDGDGAPDTLYVWRDGTTWMAHVETAAGFGAQHELDTPPAEPAAAIGGYDINGDGIDEAFAVVGSGASRTIVGLGTLYEPVGSPAIGLFCDLVGIEFGSGAAATFPVGASAANMNGLTCRSAQHALRFYVQDTADGITFQQHRYDHAYHPNFAVDDPWLEAVADWHGILTWPADAAAIERAGEFHCGTLALP